MKRYIIEGDRQRFVVMTRNDRHMQVCVMVKAIQYVCAKRAKNTVHSGNTTDCQQRPTFLVIPAHIDRLIKWDSCTIGGGNKTYNQTRTGFRRSVEDSKLQKPSTPEKRFVLSIRIPLNATSSWVGSAEHETKEGLLWELLLGSQALKMQISGHISRQMGSVYEMRWDLSFHLGKDV